MFMSIKPCLVVPTLESTIEHKGSYDKWIYFDEMTCCYILGPMKSVTKIMESLLEIFKASRTQVPSGNHEVHMNMCMKLKTPVRDLLIA